MKKFLRFSVLLAAVFFFAACQNDSESTPATVAETAGNQYQINLSDGVWHIDSVSTQTIPMQKGEDKESAISEHIELVVTGENVEVIKAYVEYEDWKQDITRTLKTKLITKEDFEASEKLNAARPENPSVPHFTLENVKAESEFYRNADESLYRISSSAVFTLSDLFEGARLELMNYTYTQKGVEITKPFAVKTEISYTKQN